MANPPVHETDEAPNGSRAALSSPDDAAFEIPFSVDSALLRELGERLVGKPHIALAELIKNSYDADAGLVHIEFSGDEIVVSDDGHGMSYANFVGRWMRIGSPHKAGEQFSTRLKRPLTGSKGIGRLAAQFLAHDLEIVTSAERSPEQVHMAINWDQAVETGELTEAVARVERRPRSEAYPNGSRHGTRIRMRGLKQSWESDDLQALARELWPLQPPFKSRRRGREAFRVQLSTDDDEGQASFDFQMTAVLELWDARISGRLSDGKLDVAVQFDDESAPRPLHLDLVPEHVTSCEFEVRVFDLRHRQPYGISVSEARSYLRQFGGVHVYDAGFHLPYYGVETDWLGIEQDHAHRLSISRLLPRDLQVDRGLNYLPTNSRLYGVVNVNTSREHRDAEDRDAEDTDLLTIQISRDRLVDNAAYQELKRIVRSAVDFYAVCEAQRAQQQLSIDGAQALPVPVRVQRVEEVLEQHRNDIPEPAFERLSAEISHAVKAASIQAEQTQGQTSMLGALATAGIAAIAYQHEQARQLSVINHLAARAQRAAKLGDLEAVTRLTEELVQVVAGARSNRDLFAYLLDDEDRTVVERYRARAVLDGVGHQLRHFLRGVAVDHSRVDDSLRLPPGRMADWSALLQNVYTNAANAMLDSEVRTLSVYGDVDVRRHHLVVQDTGSGVDLENADRLFQPFERELALSPERREMGIGGTGLGLAIVRMIATNLNCDTAFVEPESGFATAFRLSWSVR